MGLKKMAGVAFVLDLDFIDRLIRRGIRYAVRRLCVRRRKMALLVFKPLGRGAEAGACHQNIGDKNRQQSMNQPGFGAQ